MMDLSHFNQSEIRPSFSKELVLVLGGSRSGKSSWALRHMEKNYDSYLFLATAEVSDKEMAERIRLHKKSRGPKWELLEEPIEVADVLKTRCGAFDAVLLDCVTVWLSNVLFKNGAEKVPEFQTRFLNTLSQRKQAITIVSNEVGTGIVPEHALGRQFRDLAGMLNQELAALADRVVYIVAGIPMYLK
jgi:adenosylcobinamide kinase/adenosylcobinamide-phosphate guanylyltransferase